MFSTYELVDCTCVRYVYVHMNLMERLFSFACIVLRCKTIRLTRSALKTSPHFPASQGVCRRVRSQDSSQGPAIGQEPRVLRKVINLEDA